MMKFTFVAVILLNLASIAIGQQCLNFDSNMGATFDLTELQRTAGQPSYQVEDGNIPCTHSVEPLYTYQFNLCGAVTGYVEDRCREELVDTHGVSKLPTAGAIQINKHNDNNSNDDWCYVVGYYNEAASKTKLLDENDPSKGIIVTYLGDFCNGGTQRKFHIHLECADKLNPVPTHAYEYTGCEYTIFMPSVYGCPLECPVANRQLCGGNGHCAYDPDKRGARCFCNHGSYGEDCTKDEATYEAMAAAVHSPAMMGLIITLFVVVAGLVVGIYIMFKQVSAYKDDVSNYQVLKGGDEDMNSSSSPMTPGSQMVRNPVTAVFSGQSSARGPGGGISDGDAQMQGGAGSYKSPSVAL